MPKSKSSQDSKAPSSQPSVSKTPDQVSKSQIQSSSTKSTSKTSLERSLSDVLMVASNMQTYSPVSVPISPPQSSLNIALSHHAPCASDSSVSGVNTLSNMGHILSVPSSALGVGVSFNSPRISGQYDGTSFSRYSGHVMTPPGNVILDGGGWRSTGIYLSDRFGQSAQTQQQSTMTVQHTSVPIRSDRELGTPPRGGRQVCGVVQGNSPPEDGGGEDGDEESDSDVEQITLPGGSASRCAVQNCLKIAKTVCPEMLVNRHATSSGLLMDNDPASTTGLLFSVREPNQEEDSPVNFMSSDRPARRIEAKFADLKGPTQDPANPDNLLSFGESVKAKSVKLENFSSQTSVSDFKSESFTHSSNIPDYLLRQKKSSDPRMRYTEQFCSKTFKSVEISSSLLDLLVKAQLLVSSSEVGSEDSTKVHFRREASPVVTAEIIKALVEINSVILDNTSSLLASVVLWMRQDQLANSSFSLPLRNALLSTKYCPGKLFDPQVIQEAQSEHSKESNSKTLQAMTRSMFSLSRSQAQPVKRPQSSTSGRVSSTPVDRYPAPSRNKRKKPFSSSKNFRDQPSSKKPKFSFKDKKNPQ